MPQIFPRSVSTLAKVGFIAAPLTAAFSLWACLVYTRSSYGTNQNTIRVQPVPFSHEHHVGVLGIDCRYCHTSVEDSSYAGIPPTKTCMNCHSQIWVGSDDARAGARRATATDESLPLEPRLQPARLRLLRPQHPRPQGRRLHDLPRPHRRDAVHLPGALAADGVVPRLPPAARAPPAAARGGLQHANGRPPPDQARARPRAGETVRAARHRASSPLARCATDEPAKEPRPRVADLCERLDGTAGKKYWRSLEELADTERLPGADAARVPRAGLELARAS